MPSTTLQASPIVRIRAHELEPGDTIVQEGCIDLRVTGVSARVAGFILIGYQIGDSLSGRRGLVADEAVSVRRPVVEAH